MRRARNAAFAAAPARRPGTPLTSLPPEILHLIASSLVPRSHFTEDDSSSFALSWNRRQMVSPIRDPYIYLQVFSIAESRRIMDSRADPTSQPQSYSYAETSQGSKALFRLARTCKLMAAVCLPVLYQVPYTRGLENLGRLVKTLTNKKIDMQCRLKQWIMLEANYNDRYTCPIRMYLNPQQLQLTSLASLEVRIAPDRRSKLTAPFFSHILRLVRGTPSLVRLVLTAFTIDDLTHEDLDVRADGIRHVKELHLEQVFASNHTDAARFLAIFPSLRILVMYDWCGDEDEDDPDANLLDGCNSQLETFTHVGCRGFAKLHELKNLAYLCIDADVHSPTATADMGDRYGNGWLRHLAPTVESLRIVPRWPKHGCSWSLLDDWPEYLAAVEFELAQFLRTFETMKQEGMLPKLRSIDLRSLTINFPPPYTELHNPQFSERQSIIKKQLESVGIKLTMWHWDEDGSIDWSKHPQILYGDEEEVDEDTEVYRDKHGNAYRGGSRAKSSGDESDKENIDRGLSHSNPSARMPMAKLGPSTGLSTGAVWPAGNGISEDEDEYGSEDQDEDESDENDENGQGGNFERYQYEGGYGYGDDEDDDDEYDEY